MARCAWCRAVRGARRAWFRIARLPAFAGQDDLRVEIGGTTICTGKYTSCVAGTIMQRPGSDSSSFPELARLFLSAVPAT